MESLSIDELLWVVGEGADDWQPEAQAIARQELARRGVESIPIPDPDLKSDVEAASRDDAARSGRGNMLVGGGAMCIAGLSITAATYSSDFEQGGHYIIAWGVILFGFVLFLRGFFSWVDRKGPVTDGPD